MAQEFTIKSQDIEDKINQLLPSQGGFQPGVDFSYQSALMGGRLDKGGVVLDFVFTDPPDLAINVQGEYYHYGLGATYIQNDIIIRQQMAGQGINLIFIDENDVLEDVDYYVREALNYKDHSRLGGGR